ncbi:hypothetical protein BV898_06481 [Hypsibius exemplaris]|uniref:Golgin subfamily A conserved domain-containing protein n=1 Tax=Hypsibius exemplaris TaxID=2072580 RepID=A0A1W0WWB0_HYPEX|nr:hypothetical protein BV898_06481 [Hypsibius exemplaris]
MSQNMELKDRLAVLMAELDQSRQDRVLRDQRIQALEAEQRKIQHESVTHEGHQHHSSSIPSTDRSFSMEVQTDPSGEIESAPRFSPTVSPAYMKAFEAKVRNLEDEVIMYKNRQLQADSEVIYLKNALRIREEEAKLLDLTERVGAYRSLEHRFIGAMKQNAELLDRVEQLEHVIMQLQGETETIGDYIALYQSQRSLQRQRELEKVAQIDFLNQEREDLKSKLKQLQVIVRNHLQSSSSSTEHTRAPHIDLQQSGDVPDTPTPPMDSVEVATTADGETLSETVVSTDSAVLAEETRVILKLLDDIDTHIKLDPLPTSLSSFSSSSSSGNFRYTTADAMLECSCCTGDLKIV